MRVYSSVCVYCHGEERDGEKAKREYWSKKKEGSGTN